jgi:hypothetical protein
MKSKHSITVKTLTVREEEGVKTPLTETDKSHHEQAG